MTTAIEFWPWHEYVRRIAFDPLIAGVTGRPVIWTQHPENHPVFWPAPTGDLETVRDGEGWAWRFSAPTVVGAVHAPAPSPPSEDEYTRSTGERVKVRDMPTPHLQSAYDRLLAMRGPLHHELPGMAAELERRRR